MHKYIAITNSNVQINDEKIICETLKSLVSLQITLLNKLVPLATY